MSRLRHRRFLLILLSVAVIGQWGCRRAEEKGTPSRQRTRYKVVLDPGHGGVDSGASLNGGQPEKVLVLDIALEVERLLKERRFSVILTRRSDQYVSLWKRAKIANDDHADLFVSIHANSCNDDRASGFEIYYAENGRESESLQAARFIQQCLKRATGAKDRGIRKHPYLVISQTKCPSLLVEVGYLSNPREAKLLSRRSYRRKVAEGIAKGIIAAVRKRG
ncbi:N-acetylmuramoyl-L-alanine amidase [bacterium]|nr:N-acetylmuramoyl-L-alanine amidase [bacterium]